MIRGIHQPDNKGKGQRRHSIRNTVELGLNVTEGTEWCVSL
jgi:hypothetical protein